MGSLANREDPDEMTQYAAFHQGLHCLLRFITIYIIILKFLPVTP